MKPAVTRVLRLGTVIVGALIVALLVLRQPALAQLSNVFNPDPTAGIESQAQGWVTTAQGIANDLFHWLVIIEIVFFGIQLALFRDNIGDFIGGIALKIVGIGFFYYLINDGSNLIASIKDGFGQAADSMTHSSAGSDLAQIVGFITAYVAGAFALVAVQHGTDQAYSLVSAPFVLGTGFGGEANGFPVGHTIDNFITQTIIFMMVMMVGVVVLQWCITNIESYIVMFGGIIFLGFAGSKFTQPYAQGYLSYALNVGAKIFALHLVLSLIASSISSVAVYGLTGIAMQSVPGGIGAEVGIGLMVVALAKMVVLGGLAWFIPNLAGSFLQGSSTMSGSSMMSNAVGAMSGMAAMNAGQANMRIGQHHEQSLNSAQGKAHAADGAGGSAGVTALAGTGNTGGVATAISGQNLPGAAGAGAGAGAGATAGSSSGSTMVSSQAPINTGGGMYSAIASGSGNGSRVGQSAAASAPVAGPGLSSSGSGAASGGGAVSSDSGAMAAGSGVSPSVLAGNSQTPMAGAGGSRAHVSGASNGASGAASAPISASSPMGRPGAGSPVSSSPIRSGGGGGGGGGAGGGGSMSNGSGGGFAGGGGDSGGGYSSAPSLPNGQPNYNAAAPSGSSDSAFDEISQKQWDDMPAETRTEREQEMQERVESAKAAQAQGLAYALSGLAQGVPRGDQAPSAVQVRIGMPEKL